jgi:hypothetical protein
MPQGEYFTKRRTIGLLVLLCFTILGQLCGLSAEHQEHSPTEHCCLLCHIGPHATLDAVAPVFVAPVFSRIWITPLAQSSAPRSVLVSHATSRGPPVSSQS